MMLQIIEFEMGGWRGDRLSVHCPGCGCRVVDIPWAVLVENRYALPDACLVPHSLSCPILGERRIEGLSPPVTPPELAGWMIKEAPDASGLGAPHA